MKLRSPRFFQGAIRRGLLFLAFLPGVVLSADAPDDFVPCKVDQRVKIIFPVRPLNEGTTRGEVSLMIEVNREGRLGDILAFAHSGIDFAHAALDAVEQWRFTPALLAGEPIGSIFTINIDFEVNGVAAYTKLFDQPERPSIWGQRYTYRPFNLNELDRIPSALSRSSPIYPKEWIEEGRMGSVTLDYFIDEAGHTRFPRVVGAADELLGAATIAAVKLWQFDQPVRHGQPVLAQVRQVFHFYPDRSAADRKSQDGA
jgi:TonB family protein